MNYKQAEATNCIAWITGNKIVNENGSRIEFKDHRFLIDPYMDITPRQAVRKCAQIGWSVLAILRSFHLARFAKANIIHTFPSRNMTKDFVVPKVNPLIQRNPVVQKLIGTDSMHLKEIGDRFIYYRGSYEQTEAISISAHILMNDEFDRSNQQVLKTYRSRLDDAKRERPELGWEWQFSNPSIPGYGVDVLWGKSDKKHWFFNCSGCGHDWYLSFPDNIDFKRKIRVCSKCRKEITGKELRNGRWVKKHTDKKVSGYWISQMMVPWITAEKIIEDSEGDQDVFHNFVLGLPYVSKDTTVGREAIMKCLAPGYNPRTNVAIGVDNGVTKHYIVGNRYGIFEIGETDDWSHIEYLRNHYDATMVIDANPYPDIPTKLSQKYPGKVFVHYYVPDSKNVGIIRWESQVVKSDRTKIIDAVVADINAKDIIYNMTGKVMDEYIHHWKQLYRIIDVTAQGIKKPKWETIEGRPDHFAHATVYWRIALEQTLGIGGIKAAPGPGGGFLKRNLHPEVNPDQTVDALDLDEVVKRAKENKKSSWKSI